MRGCLSVCQWVLHDVHEDIFASSSLATTNSVLFLFWSLSPKCIMLTLCESKMASSSEKLIHKLIFSVSSRRANPRQSLDSKSAFSSISSHGILISTDPKQNQQKQDDNFYALLSSVSPEKNITFHQNPWCRTQGVLINQCDNGLRSPERSVVSGGKPQRQKRTWACMSFVTYLMCEVKTTPTPPPPHGRSLMCISCFRAGWLISALAFRSLDAAFLWPCSTSRTEIVNDYAC